MFASLRRKVLNRLRGNRDVLERNVIEANNIGEIRKHFRWEKSPTHERKGIFEYAYLEDINERRVRDAEIIAHAVCNTDGGTLLEIGTSTGGMTALMAQNAPSSHVYTINIPPEHILSGEGGINTTIALERELIGREYRELGLGNVTQILENTATWKPDIGQINLAFIDGSHDKQFVFNDTLKVLSSMPSGGLILWHDFNPALRKKYHWIDDVCRGIELMYKKGHLNGRILVLKDSWVGIYQVP